MRPFLHSLSASLLLLPSVGLAGWIPDGVAVCTATNYQDFPAIVSDGAGGAIVTWRDLRAGGNYNIYAQRINAAGSAMWTANGVQLCGESHNQDPPRIVSDGAGGAIVAWSDPRDDAGDIYAQRIDAAGAVQWATNGLPLCTAINRQYTPDIIADGVGGVIVMWSDGRNGSLNLDIYAQRVASNGSILWTMNGAPVCTAANNQTLGDVISDGGGGAIVTWSDVRSDPDSDVYAQRLDGFGVIQWPADGIAVCATADYQAFAKLVSDGVGGAVVTWHDTGNDIHAQRITASGALVWTPCGVLIGEPEFHASSEIVADGLGGAIVTWSWFDEFDEFDIYVQRVDASGIVKWTPGGVALATAPGEEHEPKIFADGAGGAIIAWQDSLASGNGYDIRAQRVDGSGVIQWTAGGVDVCTAASYQIGPAIASDGGSGAIIAWQDFRNGSNYDIYAQRVRADGEIATGIGDVPAASTVLVSTHPNPFSNGTMIDLDLAADADVEIDVFDVAGRRVRQLHHGRLHAGSRSVRFDGSGDDGRLLSSGVYFARVTASGTTVTSKMVIAR